MATPPRRQLGLWSTLYAAAVLSTTLRGCRAETLRSLQDHAQQEHGAMPAANGSDADAFTWRRITQYSFDADEPARMISFCTSRPAIHDMVFTMLPINSTGKEQLAGVAREASRMATAFDSTQVTRRDVAKGTQVQITNKSDANPVTHVLYRVRFGASLEGELRSPRCVDTVLNVSGTGMFVLFSEHAQTNVSVSVIDGLQREVSPTSCVTGCEDRKIGGDGANDDATRQSAMAQTASSGTRASHWAAPLLASVVIALVSLFGVLVLSLGTRFADVVIDYMMSFAAGCLLAVTVFHLYPEGSGYVADMGEWVAGTCVLGGIAVSMAFEQSLHLLLGAFGGHACDARGGERGGGQNATPGHANGQDPYDTDGGDLAQRKNDFDLMESMTSRTSHQHVTVLLQSLTSSAMAPHVRRPLQQHTTPLHRSQSIAVLGPYDRGSDATERPSQAEPVTWRGKYISSLRTVAPIAWITALGDFFHAFTDGVVLAVAFKSCSSSLGWAVALGIVLHEVPHRVGDHFIFVRAGMLVSQALALNFLASLASLLAVVIVLAVGSVSEHTLGIMLSVGAGALLFIALVKLLPPMLDVRQGGRAFVHFLCFAVGCAAIGVSMLQHTHCGATQGASYESKASFGRNKISGYVRGFNAELESICGSDQSRPAKCFRNSNTLPTAYDRAKAVARLLINGKSLCTGWLLGSNGHLVTNEHCIGSAADAAQTDYEFDAESLVCIGQCKRQLGCKGTVAARSATLVTKSGPIDYALVKLPASVASKYGYLQFRASGPKVGDKIYIPQHPAGWAKRIASTVDGGDAAKVTFIGKNNTGCGNDQVGYMADTQGGSSGSPVLSQGDNLVVALHHCGGCANLAVDARTVLKDLKSKDISVPNGSK